MNRQVQTFKGSRFSGSTVVRTTADKSAARSWRSTLQSSLFTFHSSLLAVHRSLFTPHVSYTMLEMIFALGLLALLATCFTDSLELVRRQDRWFTEENRALLVLDNTLERLAARPTRTLEEAKTVFLDEFQHSGLSTDPELSATCTGDLSQRRLVLEIRKKNRGPLAHLEFTCKSE